MDVLTFAEVAAAIAVVPAGFWVLIKIRAALSPRQHMREVVASASQDASEKDLGGVVRELLGQEEIRSLFGPDISLRTADGLLKQCRSKGISPGDIRAGYGYLEIRDGKVDALKLTTMNQIFEFICWSFSSAIFLAGIALLTAWLFRGVFGGFGINVEYLAVGAYAFVISGLYDFMMRNMRCAKKVALQVELGKDFSMREFRSRRSHFPELLRRTAAKQDSEKE